jgi:hypothetical protein
VASAPRIRPAREVSGMNMGHLGLCLVLASAPSVRAQEGAPPPPPPRPPDFMGVPMAAPDEVYRPIPPASVQSPIDAFVARVANDQPIPAQTQQTLVDLLTHLGHPESVVLWRGNEYEVKVIDVLDEDLLAKLREQAFERNAPTFLRLFLAQDPVVRHRALIAIHDCVIQAGLRAQGEDVRWALFPGLRGLCDVDPTVRQSAVGVVKTILRALHGQLPDADKQVMYGALGDAVTREDVSWVAYGMGKLLIDLGRGDLVPPGVTKAVEDARKWMPLE